MSQTKEQIGLDGERQAAARAEQERIARQATRLIDVIERNSTLPLAVSQVRILGTKQTRPSFLKSVTAPLHSPDPSTPQTLATVLDATNQVFANLIAFNIFDPTKSSVHFDRATSPLSGPNDLDVLIHLTERPRFAAAQTANMSGDGEVSGQMSARAENLFGGAERVEAVLQAGTLTKNAWEVKFQTPIAARPDVWGEIGIFRVTRDQKFFASHELLQRGAYLKIRTPSNIGLHELTLSTILRQVGSLSTNASPSIVTEAGESIKTSLSHSITRDARDDPLLPTAGHVLKSTQELAGLGDGNVKFFKATAEAQFVKTFPQFSPRTHFVLGARTGVLWSLERNGRTRITDRFHLGGPTDVRGFKHFGIGPKDGNDSVGGEAFLAYSASVLFPVPNTPESWPLRLQTFVSAGSLVPLNQKDIGGTFSELWKRPSVGMGIGVTYSLPIARVELNFGVPLVMRQGDWSRKGFQFGVGLEFM